MDMVIAADTHSGWLDMIAANRTDMLLTVTLGLAVFAIARPLSRCSWATPVPLLAVLWVAAARFLIEWVNGLTWSIGRAGVEFGWMLAVPVALYVVLAYRERLRRRRRPRLAYMPRES